MTSADGQPDSDASKPEASRSEPPGPSEPLGPLFVGTPRRKARTRRPDTPATTATGPPIRYRAAPGLLRAVMLGAAVLVGLGLIEAVWRAVRVVPLQPREDEWSLALTPDLFGLDTGTVVTEGGRSPLAKSLQPGGVIRFTQHETWTAGGRPFPVQLQIDDYPSADAALADYQRQERFGAPSSLAATMLAWARTYPEEPPGWFLVDVRETGGADDPSRSNGPNGIGVQDLSDESDQIDEGGSIVGRRLVVRTRRGRRLTTITMPLQNEAVAVTPELIDRLHDQPATAEPERPRVLPWSRWLPKRLLDQF